MFWEVGAGKPTHDKLERERARAREREREREVCVQQLCSSFFERFRKRLWPTTYLYRFPFFVWET